MSLNRYAVQTARADAYVDSPLRIPSVLVRGAESTQGAGSFSRKWRRFSIVTMSADRAGLARPGLSAHVLEPLVEALRHYVFDCGKLHADDKSVPVLAPGTGKPIRWASCRRYRRPLRRKC